MHHRKSAFRSACFALMCAPILVSLAEQAAADAQPYQARVIASAAVHSGPGENFYPTDTLKQGDVVEVYREKPGGWLAIRPPMSSFSWVAARDLIVKDGGLAEVAKDDVASRIGSRLNDRHNAAQVRLKKGEAVEVLGEETVNGEKWCKIAPPSGEFRWVQASLVEKLGSIPAPSAPAAPPATSSAAPSTAASGAPPLLPTATKAPETSAPATPIAAPPAATPSSAASLANQQPTASASTSGLSSELAAMELRLSRMAAAPPNLWNTERLERDAAQLMARAQTQPERDAVRVTQDKIDRFAEIVRRYNQATGNVAQSSQSPITPLPNTVASTAAGGPYDAVGILRPIVSRRPGAPQFALVDERGQVVTFIFSTPDLNLQPYVGHRIGVVGNRGFIPEFQRGTVTATRVTPLTERVLR